MTAERLYYHDSYLREFDARVVARTDDGRRIYLDRTAFYPTSGGQPHDLGTLGGAPVVDVVDEGERVAHVLDTPLAPDAVDVHGVIDWARRFDHMQQHAGQHLLSAVFLELFGMATVSVHFGAESSSLDLDAGAVTCAQLVEAEARANALVAEHRPIAVTFESAGEASGLRRPSGRSGELRIVTIAGVDRSACGGTHVHTTAEIGPVLVGGVEKIRKSARIEFVCGARALARARADRETLLAVARELSTSPADVPAVLASRAADQRSLELDRRRLARAVAGHEARRLHEQADVRPSGLRVAIVRDAASAEEVRETALAYGALPRSLFIAALASPLSVVVASSEDSGVDAGQVLKEAMAAHGGRGGGSPRLAQGSVPDTAAQQAVVDRLAR